MAYTLTKAEKETTLLYNQTQEPITISTYDSSLQRRLANFAKKYPNLCKRTDKKLFSDYAAYEIEKSRVSIRLVPPYSEERRKAASEMAQKQKLGEKRRTDSPLIE